MTGWSIVVMIILAIGMIGSFATLTSDLPAKTRSSAALTLLIQMIMFVWGLLVLI
jgi:hypothetical protein